VGWVSATSASTRRGPFPDGSVLSGTDRLQASGWLRRSISGPGVLLVRRHLVRRSLRRGREHGFPGRRGDGVLVLSHVIQNSEFRILITWFTDSFRYVPANIVPVAGRRRGRAVLCPL